jgi:hypothetical protein
MQPYAPKAPSREDALIEALRSRSGDPLSIEAADAVERLRAREFKLARRIHQQRCALRETWQIVEQRRNWLGSPVARKKYHWLWEQYQKLRQVVALPK